MHIDIFANLVGVPRLTIHRLISEHGMPSTGLEIEPALAWQWALSVEQRGRDQREFEGERERLASEQADAVSIKNELSRGNVIRVDEALAVLLPAVGALKASLLASAEAIAQDISATYSVPAAEVRKLIWEATRSALETSANQIQGIAPIIDDELGSALTI